MRVSLVVPGGFPGLPTYRTGEETPAPGSRVVAPFGTKLVTGIVADVDPPPAPEGVEEREIVAALDAGAFLPPALVRVLVRAAAYYVVASGEMLRAAVPARLLAAGEALFVPANAAVGAAPDDPREREVLGAILEAGRLSLRALADRAGRERLWPVLRALLDRGLVRIPQDAYRAARAPVTRAFVGRPASADHPALRRSPKRRALHAHLMALGRPAGRRELQEAGGSPAVLSALVTAGLAAVVEEEKRTDLAFHAGVSESAARPVPTEAQAVAIAAIRDAVTSGSPRELLLHGVTGSGKTEVYISALEEVCRAGRQGILLVPEIALAPALVRRVVARFGERVSLLHSALSDGERAAEWERARRGEVDAVVGPRSAVFAPLPRLGLIVVDEAHDAAYKQGESPRYDARDLARARAREEGAIVLFGSATPPMELERAAREGRMPRLVLPERPGARPRGEVEVVDLRKEAAREGDHGRVLFAERTLAILRETFARGEQAIVLLNRRGFSPNLLCRACGEDFRCRNCSVARTYHLRGERLLCHYCGDVLRRPAACPQCASTALMPIGFGTERLAERFAEHFPDVPYAVLDRDAAARRGGAAAVLADFEAGNARALLGTQMVAKGHDFPNVTALAVLEADALLSFPDFRAAERTFQLVTQAAGRVGRGDRPGVVAVQTARPEHEAIRCAVAQDTATFADAELRFRRAFRYPPYTRLLLALFTGPEERKVAAAAAAGAAALAAAPVASALRILGPAPAPIDRLRGQWRHHLLLKSESRDALAEAGRILAAMPEPPRLDVDPQDLL